MTPVDYYNRGNPNVYLGGGAVKIWTWVFYANTSISPAGGIQIDARTYADFDSRPVEGQTMASGENNVSTNSRQAAYAAHPTFGMNGVYVGGHYRFGAFSGTAVINGQTTVTEPIRKAHYLNKFSGALNPSKLIFAGSARSGDITASANGYWSWWQAPANTGTIRPGAPVIHAPSAGPGATAFNWTNPSNKFNPLSLPSTYGMMDFRHIDKAVVCYIDNHVEAQGIEELRDMRKWSNWAPTANWTFAPRQ
jgi:hypothetical protein